MNLVLGVLDVAYSDASPGGAKTTGDVAQILEAKYHIMETFYQSRQQKIGEWLAESVADAITAVVSGRHVQPTFDAEQQIEASFREFLNANEMAILGFLTDSERDYYLTHTPAYTGAANAGVNHRKKHPYSQKNKARPVFIDTGLYVASMRAWIEE